MSVSVEIYGIIETLQMLSRARDRVKGAMRNGLTKSARHVQLEVKASIAGQRAEPTSVDTGRLLNSVDVRVGTETAYVETNVKYAQFIEYGTSKIAPRRHFRNSVERSREKVKEIFKEEVVKELKKK